MAGRPSLSRLRTRLLLWRCAEVGEGVEVLGRVWIHGGGRVCLGAFVRLDGRAVPVELHVEPRGELLIGDGAVLEGGASVEAQRRVVIGPRCHLKSFAKVMDNHFHPVAGDRNRRPESAEVRLDEGVVVGERAVVLPGAWLEAGVVLAPGTVVGRRVRAGLHLEGVPPRAAKGAR